MIKLWKNGNSLYFLLEYAIQVDSKIQNVNSWIILKSLILNENLCEHVN